MSETISINIALNLAREKSKRRKKKKIVKPKNVLPSIRNFVVPSPSG
jgi:hypothetical protein